MSVAKMLSIGRLCECPLAWAKPSNDPAPSLQSRAFNLLLRQLPYKQQLASAEAVQAHVQKLALEPVSFEPPNLAAASR